MQGSWTALRGSMSCAEEVKFIISITSMTTSSSSSSSRATMFGISGMKLELDHGGCRSASRYYNYFDVHALSTDRSDSDTILIRVRLAARQVPLSSRSSAQSTLRDLRNKQASPFASRRVAVAGPGNHHTPLQHQELLISIPAFYVASHMIVRYSTPPTRHVVGPSTH